MIRIPNGMTKIEELNNILNAKAAEHTSKKWKADHHNRAMAIVYGKRHYLTSIVGTPVKQSQFLKCEFREGAHSSDITRFLTSVRKDLGVEIHFDRGVLDNFMRWSGLSIGAQISIPQSALLPVPPPRFGRDRFQTPACTERVVHADSLSISAEPSPGLKIDGLKVAAIHICATNQAMDRVAVSCLIKRIFRSPRPSETCANICFTAEASIGERNRLSLKLLRVLHKEDPDILLFDAGSTPDPTFEILSDIKLFGGTTQGHFALERHGCVPRKQFNFQYTSGTGRIVLEASQCLRLMHVKKTLMWDALAAGGGSEGARWYPQYVEAVRRGDVRCAAKAVTQALFALEETHHIIFTLAVDIPRISKSNAQVVQRGNVAVANSVMNVPLLSSSRERRTKAPTRFSPLSLDEAHLTSCDYGTGRRIFPISMSSAASQRRFDKPLGDDDDDESAPLHSGDEVISLRELSHTGSAGGALLMMIRGDESKVIRGDPLIFEYDFSGFYPSVMADSRFGLQQLVVDDAPEPGDLLVPVRQHNKKALRFRVSSSSSTLEPMGEYLATLLQARRSSGEDQQALKFVANAFYGSLGCGNQFLIQGSGIKRFQESVEARGKFYLYWVISVLTHRWGGQVIGGVTDSVWVRFPSLSDRAEAHRRAASALEFIQERLPPLMRLRVQGVYSKMYMIRPTAYCAIPENKAQRPDLKGLSFVRRDYPSRIRAAWVQIWEAMARALYEVALAILEDLLSTLLTPINLRTASLLEMRTLCTTISLGSKATPLSKRHTALLSHRKTPYGATAKGLHVLSRTSACKPGEKRRRAGGAPYQGAILDIWEVERMVFLAFHHLDVQKVHLDFCTIHTKFLKPCMRELDHFFPGPRMSLLQKSVSGALKRHQTFLEQIHHKQSGIAKWFKS